MKNFLHIITSKDRGAQLEAQLRTLSFFKGSVRTVVIYTTSSDDHESVYTSLKELYPHVFFLRERNYKADIESFIFNSKEDFIFFTPDDGCFIREVDFSKIEEQLSYYKDRAIYSLRLGRHIRICHPAGNKPEPVPEYDINAGGCMVWDWRRGKLDWGYPLALDGSIFPKNFLLKRMAALNYNKPTTLEVGLQSYNASNPLTVGICEEKSQFVSIPWNVVTDQMSNPSSEISESIFLAEWNKGNRIVLDHIIGTEPISCHYEYNLIWKNKDGLGK